MLISEGKIKLVLDGKSPESIVAEKTIDLKGQHLYPGLIALNSALGLSEIEAVHATRRTRLKSVTSRPTCNHGLP